MESETETKKEFLMKNRGLQGIVGAAIVLGVVVVVVTLSKFNDIRSGRLPFVWRRRLKSLVLNSASHVKLAEESVNMFIAYHHAVQADAILKSAKDMVGQNSLARMTGYNIEKLDSEIDRWLSMVPSEGELPNKPKMTGDSKKVHKTRFYSPKVKQFLPQ